MRRFFFVFAPALALSGCVSMSALQTAETLEAGKHQTTFGGGYYQSDSFAKTVDAKDLKVPFLEFSYREGIAPRWDAGVKLTLIGSAVLDGKYQFYDGAGLDLAAGLGVGYFEISSGEGDNKVSNRIIDGIVPLYASYKFTDSFSLYASPRYVYRTGSSSSMSLGGGSGGFKIGKTWGVYLEAGYQRELGRGTDGFDATQYNIAFFSESPGSLLKTLGL